MSIIPLLAVQPLYAQEETVIYMPVAYQGATDAGSLGGFDPEEIYKNGPVKFMDEGEVIYSDEELLAEVEEGLDVEASGMIRAASINGSSDLVKNIIATSGRSYRLSKCKKYENVYTDRDYTFTKFSSKGYHNVLCIITANNDKNNGSDALLSFDITHAARIRIYFDRRATRNPSWFGNKYIQNTKKIYTTDSGMKYFEVFSCDSKPGRITLGGPQRGSKGVGSMYVVQIVKIDASKGKTDCSTKASAPPPPPPSTGPRTLYVRPNANGNGTQSRPFGKIQKAIDAARPGDTIYLSGGNYKESFITKRHGETNKPIIIKGPRNAVVRGESHISSGSKDNIIQIHHNHIILDGFTLNGHDGSHYWDKLVFAAPKKQNNHPSSGQTLHGPRNMIIRNMDLLNGGGECVRLRWNVRHARIHNNKFTRCGATKFNLNQGKKNGEAVYIGTADNDSQQKKNYEFYKFTSYRHELDRSGYNRVHNNVFNTQGNECVDLKEGAQNNVIYQNSCTGQRDPESAGFASAGNNNVFVDNTIFNNVGFGIRIGDDKRENWFSSYGRTNNQIVRNRIYGNQAGSIKFVKSQPNEQIVNRICGVNLSGPPNASLGKGGKTTQNHLNSYLTQLRRPC